MRRGQRLPNNQAEVVFLDSFVEQIAERAVNDQIEVLAEVIRLCDEPAGKHPLRAPLVGWNTLDVLGGHHRVVYRASIVKGCGLIEVLCIGPRSGDVVYDIACALIDAHLLTEAEVTALWDALAILDVIEEEVGLDGWDYAPPPAPDGMVRAAVAAGVLDESVARLMSLNELQAALEHGWNHGEPDPEAAVLAALERARSRAREVVDARSIILARLEGRCAVLMPRAGARCIRREHHPGPHRAR